MRKIKRFAVNESGFVLSPEEMRHINGGYFPGCKTVACEVYEKYGSGKYIDEGNCGPDYVDGYAVCACITKSHGSIPGEGACDDN